MKLPKNEWSESLKIVKPAIKELYFKGNIKLLTDSGPKLAIVGSRKMTEYSKRIIEKWMGALVERGVVIVSGFMYGVDQIAHQTCVDLGGKTIAVLGYGIERKISGLDEKLYRKILEREGLIVSEYPDDTPADKWTFPQRNRIVAGISDAIWVVEGAIGSGSMITANLGVKSGKTVMALPGLVGNKTAGGVNELIKKGLARMTTSVDDLFDCLGMSTRQISLDESANPLVVALENGPKTADELVNILRMPTEKLMREIALCCLRGEIEECEKGYQRGRYT